jgi:CubicO group peptidase (beta-lactamase class C family)
MNNPTFPYLFKRSIFPVMLLIASSQPLLPPPSVGANSGASRKEAERLARFENQVEQFRSLLKIPGLSAAIIRHQEVSWAKGFGYADMEKAVPAKPDTVYHIASLTKTFAATILMQLVEQGRLDLDEPMSHYSSDFKDDKVKVKHLLSHTSGGTPGDRYAYDGAQYAYLTAVIEKKTGKPFRRLMAEIFLDPLKMSDSVPGRDVLTEANKQSEIFRREKLNHYQAVLAKSAQPYRLYGEEAVHTGYGWGGISAAAGLLTTAIDMAKFDIAIDDHVFLNKETQDRAWTPFVSNGGRPLPHGLGWFAQNHMGARIIWHFGYDPDSFSATYVKVPDKSISLILLANSDALSAPFVHGSVMKSSPLVTSFLRIFIIEDAEGHTLPDPNWAANAEGFSDEIARLKQRAGGYSYDVELASYKAMIKWLEDHRRQARTAITIDPATYDAYVGQYQLPDGTIITLTRERDRLMVDIPNYVKSELFAATGLKYFLKTLDGDWAFVKNEEGRVTHIEVNQGGQVTILKKIK